MIDIQKQVQDMMKIAEETNMNNYRDRANDLTSQYQQLNHECHQYIRNIRGPMIVNPK